MRLRLIGALAIVAACGGADAVDVLGSSDGGTGGGSDASTSETSATSDGSTTSDSGAKPDTGGNPSVPDPGLVSCGDDQCARTGAIREICCFTQNGATCQSEALAGACAGHRLSCDEKADCENGVCCVEPIANERVQTRCLPTCTTDSLRYQVCKTNGECQSGSCKAYDCGANMPPLKFCQRPPECK